MTRIFQQDPLNFRSLPASVRALLCLNVAVYLMLVLGTLVHALDLGLFEHFAILPGRVFRWPVPELWRLLTHPFLHGDFKELLISLVALWFFGAPVVAQWGDREFLAYFYVCTLGAAAPLIAMGHPVAGSSAASYGMLLAFAMLYPEAQVYFFFLPMRPWMMITLFILLDVMVGTSVDFVRLVFLASGLAAGYVYIRWSWVMRLNMKASLRALLEREADDAPPARATPSRRPARPAAGRTEDDEMAEVDRILDKILASGLDSLSDDERGIMARYSKRIKPS